VAQPVTHPALSLIEAIGGERARLASQPRSQSRLHSLQEWQVRRLKRTYADFHALPRYRAAIEFFVHDLYGPHDFSRRDRDLHRVIAPWARILPERGLQAVVTALELELLTLQLDLAVLDALPNGTLDAESYAEAYRAADRRDDRRRQIDLVLACGRTLDRLVEHPWFARALRLAKVPAQLAGVRAFHDFLERGYKAFRLMGDANELLAAIDARETAFMNNLFAGRADPFLLPPLERDRTLQSASS
jgi:hypothetical protein